MTRKLPAEIRTDIGVANSTNILSTSIMTLCFWISLAAVLLMVALGSYLQASVLGIMVGWMGWNCIPLIVYSILDLRTSNDLIEERYAKVEREYLIGLRILNRLGVRRSFFKALMLVQIGRMRMYQGFFDGAEDPMEDAILIAKHEKLYSKSPSMGMLHANLGAAYLRQERFVEAEVQFEEALALLGGNHPLCVYCTAYVKCFIASIRFELDELDEAYELTTNSLSVLKSRKPPPPLQLIHARQAIINCYAVLATIDMRKKNFDDARSHADSLMRTLSVDSQILTVTNVKYLRMLADEYLINGDFDRAEDLLNFAYSVASNSPFHPDSQDVLLSFEKLLLVTDRGEEVSDMKSWLRSSSQLISF